MERLLHGECTIAGMDAINSRVINSPVDLQNGSLGKLTMEQCWMAQTITFRNKVSTTFISILAFSCILPYIFKQ